MKTETNQKSNTQVHNMRKDGTLLVFVQLELVVVFFTQAMRFQGDSTICKHTSMRVAMCLLGHHKTSLRDWLQHLVYHIDSLQSSGVHDKSS
jgi:hypothetical protein